MNGKCAGESSVQPLLPSEPAPLGHNLPAKRRVGARCARPAARAQGVLRACKGSALDRYLLRSGVPGQRICRSHRQRFRQGDGAEWSVQAGERRLQPHVRRLERRHTDLLGGQPARPERCSRWNIRRGQRPRRCHVWFGHHGPPPLLGRLRDRAVQQSFYPGGDGEAARFVPPAWTLSGHLSSGWPEVRRDLEAHAAVSYASGCRAASTR
jgi:hypothetical protein